jgi:hypothetical protein
MNWMGPAMLFFIAARIRVKRAFIYYNYIFKVKNGKLCKFSELSPVQILKKWHLKMSGFLMAGLG